jgi:hypothetical protein
MICIHNTAQVLGMHVAGSSIKVLSAYTRCSRKGPAQRSKASSHFKWIASSSPKLKYRCSRTYVLCWNGTTYGLRFRIWKINSTVLYKQFTCSSSKEGVLFIYGGTVVKFVDCLWEMNFVNYKIERIDLPPAYLRTSALLTKTSFILLRYRIFSNIIRTLFRVSEG